RPALGGGGAGAGAARHAPDRVTIPESGDPSYRRWLPAPSAMDSFDSDHYRSRYLDLAALRKHSDRTISTFHRERVGAHLEFLGVGDSAEGMVSLSGVGSTEAYVVFGSYETDAVFESVRESDFSETGTDGEYRFLHRNDPSRTVAVGEDGVVYARDTDSESFVKAILDAERGDELRYHETDEAFASMTDVMGAPAVATAETTDPTSRPNPETLRFEGSVGHATGRSLADGTEYVRHAIRFADAADDRTETVRETVGDDDSFAEASVFAEDETVFLDAELESEG
ncbi:hypothetical protein, partial [Halorussus amylolyticus]|uniref:hypothetical protein n=1 Tax=Halorussus amylolyticus TaxID=1126242 RepID=UPI00192FAC71